MTENKKNIKNIKNENSTDSIEQKPDSQSPELNPKGEASGLEAKPKPSSSVQKTDKTSQAQDKGESKAPQADSSKDSVKASESSDTSKDSVKASKSSDTSKDSVKASESSGASKDSAKASKSSSEESQKKAVRLRGLFAFKQSMTTFYNEKGESVPVTALKYEPCFISQVKTQDKESYNAIQVAFKAQKNKRCSKALIGHLSPAGFKEGARFVREIRQEIPEGIQKGQELSIESLQKGDLVKISSLSKGRGFSGVMKKWNFGGGKASHGSKSHRRTGSIGQHTEPARVMPGRKMPGQYGNKKVSKLKTPVVEVFSEEGIIFVKGPVPGARNSLVSLVKM